VGQASEARGAILATGGARQWDLAARTPPRAAMADTGADESAVAAAIYAVAGDSSVRELVSARAKAPLGPV